MLCFVMQEAIIQGTVPTEMFSQPARSFDSDSVGSRRLSLTLSMGEHLFSKCTWNAAIFSKILEAMIQAGLQIKRMFNYDTTSENPLQFLIYCQNYHDLIVSTDYIPCSFRAIFCFLY